MKHVSVAGASVTLSHEWDLFQLLLEQFALPLCAFPKEAEIIAVLLQQQQSTDGNKRLQHDEKSSAGNENLTAVQRAGVRRKLWIDWFM